MIIYIDHFHTAFERLAERGLYGTKKKKRRFTKKIR